MFTEGHWCTPVKRNIINIIVMLLQCGAKCTLMLFLLNRIISVKWKSQFYFCIISVFFVVLLGFTAAYLFSVMFVSFNSCFCHYHCCETNFCKHCSLETLSNEPSFVLYYVSSAYDNRWHLFENVRLRFTFWNWLFWTSFSKASEPITVAQHQAVYLHFKVD